MTIQEGQVYLEPRELLDAAIIGVYEGKNVYELHALIKNYAKSFISSDTNPVSDDAAYETAAEFVDYNTIPALPYMGPYAPLVVSEIEEGFEDDLPEGVDFICMNGRMWEILC